MLADRTQLLYDLLRALFRFDSELDRFLALEGIDIDASRSSNQAASKIGDSYDTARTLVDRDLVDEKFFAALERRSPERVEDIRRVADAFSEDDPYPGTSTAPGDDPSPYAAFAAQLSASLDALDPEDDTQLCLDPDHWPWTAPASVLGSFDPLDLKPLPNVPVRVPAMTALRDLVTTGHDIRWVMREEIRSTCLAELVRTDRLSAALDANRDVTDRRRDLVDALVDALVDDVAPSLSAMERDELVDLDAVLTWLTPHVPSLPVTRSDVRAAVERRLLIDPLRALVGTHFQGRAEELAQLDAHLDGRNEETVLLIRGAGGSGKSTLLGHVILDLERSAENHEYVSYAYLDFDRTRNDPRDRDGLLRELAQQLRLLYATSAVESDFAAFESAYSGTDAERAAELLDIDVSLDSAQLLDTLCRRLLDISAVGKPPLVLFLDTFEEVMAKGPGAVDDVGQLVRDLAGSLPGMRVVVSGRSVPDTLGLPSQQRELGDLDPDAAQALLEQLGVTDPAMRQAVVESFGRNPLTLHLAAEAVSRAIAAGEDLQTLVPQSRALVDLALEQVQGMLYNRILGHIKDPEVASVAHPGLAVRLITVDVLREVLAEPCGIDPSHAEDVFTKLRAELSLFEVRADGSLWHRQDVRRIMLRAMDDDPQQRDTIADIHHRAVRYYAARQGPVARAEGLYHRLMSDEEPRSLDPLWEDDLVMELAPALEEPLSPRARRWLQRRVVTGDIAEDRAEWEQEDWEANAHSRATSWLASGSADKALEVLGEREQRLPASRLYAVEATARLGVHDLAAADAALEAGLDSCRSTPDRRTALELAETAVAVRAAQGDAAGLAAAGLNCASAADFAGEPARGLRSLATTVTELRRLGAPAELERASAELVRRFGLVTAEQMLADPDLVRQVVRAVGEQNSSVLAHAVVSVGDQPDAVSGVFRPDTFALTRLLEGTTDAAAPALSQLAEQVGLKESGWKTEQLASRLVRTGRTAEALTLSLDYASDKDATSALFVNELLQPIGGGTSAS